MYDILMVGTCHYAVLRLSKPKACTTTRINPNVNYGLWGNIMCQFGLISCKNCPILVGAVDNGKGCVGGEVQGYYGKSLYALLSFAVNLKLL